MSVAALDIRLPPMADAEAWRNREWLVTNGLGGYASGTLAGVCTRRYHGVFVPNLPHPRGRHVLVSRLDEEVHCGGQVFRLGDSDRINQPLVAGNAPWLEAFRLEGNMACWTFRCGDVRLTRRLVMPHQRNTTLLRYEVTGGRATVRIRPFLPFRRQDAPLREPGYGCFQLSAQAEGNCRVGLPDSGLWMAMRLHPAGVPFVADALEVPDAGLWREQLRGYDSHEALASPGFFEWQAAPGEPVVLVLTTEEADAAGDPLPAFQEESRRHEALVKAAGAEDDAFLARLAVAADQFLILPESRLEEEGAAAARQGHALRTTVAGYHWFLDWGRDTMIALEGLMLATGRHGEARATLLTFAHYVRDGLLPNLFPEGSREGAYHTADATLWYFHAIHRYVEASGDGGVLAGLLPVLRDILRHHLEGTRFGIGMDGKDGLLRAGTPEHALTWMDAHMGEWIVTPRRGKPVEIQALWHNALCLMARWEGQAGESWQRLAQQVRESFNRRFWNPARNCLFDVVDGEDGDDARLRPNQLFAICLDHPVLERGRWQAVLDAVARELLTPVGLRTLEPSDPQYVRYYHGNLAARDSAYHQGTVWPWLLGAYVDAFLKAHGDPAAARRLLEAFPAHLQVAGLGTISEVFDGEPPHNPHGCIAQAWSVAEVLRCWKRTAPGKLPPD